MQCNVGPRKRTPSPLLLSRILVQLKMTIALYPVCTAVQQGPSQSSQSHFLSSFAHRVFLAAVFATSLSLTTLASLSIEMTTTPDQRENEAGRGVRRRMDQERVSSFGPAHQFYPGGRVDFSTHFAVDSLNRSIWVNKLTRSICM